MRRFNIRQVEAFRAVVALGGMTKAAQALGVSQPAISRLMMDFQETVGFKLFQRHRGVAEPTDDARRLFEQVDKLFLGLEELEREAEAIKSLSTGSVSIAAMGIYANGFLPRIIARHAARHPGIAVSLTTQSQDRVVDWVEAGRADLGFVTMPIARAGVPVRRLLRRSALCVFPAGHEFERRERVRIADFAGRPFVSFSRGAAFRYEVDALFDRAGIERVLLVEAASHESVCHLVAAGVGVSIVSPFSPHLHGNPALSFRPFEPAMPIEIGMMADPERLSLAARSFHDDVLAFVDEMPGVGAGPPRIAAE